MHVYLTRPAAGGRRELDGSRKAQAGEPRDSVRDTQLLTDDDDVLAQARRRLRARIADLLEAGRGSRHRRDAAIGIAAPQHRQRRAHRRATVDQHDRDLIAHRHAIRGLERGP